MADEITLEATDLYVRFLPRDTTQYDEMMKDTSMIYYEYPLDYEIEQQGDVYIDTTVAEGQIGWQYTVVKPDFIISDTLTYEILSELFIPENHPDYVEEEDDEEISNGRIKSKSQLLVQLETMSLYLSGNLEEEEKQQMQIANGRVTRTFKRRKWRPSGRIRIQDTELGWRPMQGVKVLARRWFTTKTGYTNSNGYYSCGRFRRKVNYSIKWERHDFSIREYRGRGFNGQAKINGPKRRGGWNLDIRKHTKDWFHGTIFQATFHYYYENIRGLRRPPENSRWKPQMKISARNHSETAHGSYNQARRFLGIKTPIRIYRNGRDSDEIYATTIHELAHASHWRMSRHDFGNGMFKVLESWATGVQWELTRMKYRRYLGIERSTGFYTSVVADMIDGPATEQTRINHGYIDADKVDNVSGYKIRQLEDALVGARTWNEWRDNIKRKFNNSTEDNLNELFAAYE